MEFDTPPCNIHVIREPCGLDRLRCPALGDPVAPVDSIPVRPVVQSSLRHGLAIGDGHHEVLVGGPGPHDVGLTRVVIG